MSAQVQNIIFNSINGIGKCKEMTVHLAGHWLYIYNAMQQVIMSPWVPLLLFPSSSNKVHVSKLMCGSCAKYYVTCQYFGITFISQFAYTMLDNSLTRART